MVRFPFYGKYIGELTLCVKTIMGDSSPNQLGERVQGFEGSRGQVFVLQGILLLRGDPE